MILTWLCLCVMMALLLAATCAACALVTRFRRSWERRTIKMRQMLGSGAVTEQGLTSDNR